MIILQAAPKTYLQLSATCDSNVSITSNSPDFFSSQFTVRSVKFHVVNISLLFVQNGICPKFNCPQGHNSEGISEFLHTSVSGNKM